MNNLAMNIKTIERDFLRFVLKSKFTFELILFINALMVSNSLRVGFMVLFYKDY